MASEELLKKSIRFFYFALLDDQKAIGAAQKTWSSLSKVSNQEEQISEFVKISYKVWKKESAKPTFFNSQSDICRLPSSAAISNWRAFKKVASEEEFIATLWAKVLKFSEEDIAVGLGITPGTVRFRLSNGLRKLGSLCGEGHV